MASSAKDYQMLSCLKLFLVIFTVIYLCTGVLFLAAGIYGLLALSHYFELSPLLDVSITPILLCVVGGVIITSGLFGIVAAIKNSKSLINSYCFLLTLVFIVEIAGGVAAILFLSKIEDSFRKGFNDSIASFNYTNSMDDSLSRAQIDLQCCGTSSYKDWFHTAWANNTRDCPKKSPGHSGFAVPPSCCKQSWNEASITTSVFEHQNTCYCGNSTELIHVNQQGCLVVLFGSDRQTLYYLLATSFGCALVQLFSMILSFCIFCKLKDLRYRRGY